MPQDAPGRPDLVTQRTLILREFDEVQRTIVYACEAPVEMEARLGSYARALTEGRSRSVGAYSSTGSGSTTSVGNPASTQPSMPSGYQITFRQPASTARRAAFQLIQHSGLQ